MAFADRDTDADWRALGETQPFWGVNTQDDFLVENLTPENVEALYAGGRDYIGSLAARFQRLTGRPRARRALDFGCGVGRLAEALADHADEAVGYDISPGMLERARQRGKATYVSELPAGPFDWINTFIVFQHIPPVRGMALLGELLDRLAPGGFVSLHFTIWRDDRIPPTPTETPAPAPPQGWRALFRSPPPPPAVPAGPPTGAIMMYDYDLTAIVQALNCAGIVELELSSTDHGGHHGVIIFGVKTEKLHA